VRDGDLVKAEPILKSLAESRYPGLSVAADFERVLLGLNQKPNDPVLLAALRERVPLWRGHPQEIDMIDRLARRYRAAKEPREALTLWQHLALIHPETDDDPSIREPRQATYTEAIKTLAGQEIELLDAYAIYLDFIDLLPSAPDARLVHRSLANHLAGLDLLSEALVVLQPLFESATDESEKAEIGSKMAALLLVQGRPQEALAILERAKAGSVAPSGDLAARWQIMSARALARLDREDEALRQIRDLQTADARQVRAEIFWHLRNWSRLAGVIESYLDDPALTLPLEEDDQKLVLWLALAREQLSQTRGLDELRRRFAADMASGPWSGAFLVATQVDSEAADVMSNLAQAERQLAELKRFRDDTRANP
jgi:tetratricopeptide (TPR) repeat protein